MYSSQYEVLLENGRGLMSLIAVEVFPILSG